MESSTASDATLSFFSSSGVLIARIRSSTNRQSVNVLSGNAPCSALPASTGRNDNSAPMPRVLMPALRMCSIAFCMVSTEPELLQSCTGVQNGWLSRWKFSSRWPK